MNSIIDPLKIKVEKARKELPPETLYAIDSVDWRSTIIALRQKKGYTFEQLGDLEIETELLLSGLITPKEYPIELEKRMGLSKEGVNDLINEMNVSVFQKIREELIKRTETKKVPVKVVETFKEEDHRAILSSHGIDVIPSTLPSKTMDFEKERPVTENREEVLGKIERPEKVDSILSERMSGALQTKVVKTEHTLENITKTTTPSGAVKAKVSSVDPYRELPE